MRAAGIAGISRRRSAPITTRQATGHHPASDLVRRNFIAERPNELWAADITFLPTLAGFLYLAVVLDAISRTIVTLPEQLRRSLTWDQGAEMAQHARLKIEAGVRVYFCDPHSPWQRGTNENTNGLLRQYFPKGTDLSMHSANEIAAVAAALNSRPRKTLDWKTPAEALDRFLLSADKDRVATTA